MEDKQKKKNVLDVFNLTAKNYVEHFGNDWEFIKEIDDFIQSVGEQATVLDLGCGSGYITNYLSQNKITSIGIDFSEKMIDIAKRMFPTDKFIQMDISDVDKYFNENTFDGLLAMYSLYFIPKNQTDEVLTSLSKILKDGGRMLLVTQCGHGEQYVDESLMPDGKGEKALFVNLYDQFELRTLLEKNNFVIENIRLVPNVDPDEIAGDGRLVLVVSNNKTLRKDNNYKR